MGKQQDQRGYRKTLSRVAIFVTATLVVAAGAIAAVNLLVLPRVAERLERSLGNDDTAVRIGGLRYWPFYGVILRNVALNRDLQAAGARTATSLETDVQDTPAAERIPGIGVSSVEIKASRIRIRSPESLAIRWIRASRSDPFALHGMESRAALFAAAERIATSGLIPKRITLRGVGLKAQVQRGAPIIGYSRRIDLVHDSRGSIMYVLASESPASTLSGNLSMNYDNRTASAHLHFLPSVLSIAPLAAGEASFELSLAFDDSSPIDISGTLSMTGLSIKAPAVAEEPISDIDIHYDFEAVYDMQANEHRFTGQIAKANRTPAVIGTSDRLATSSGKLRVNEIALELKPVVYGLLDGPAVVRLIVKLPKTEAQSIIDSVPEAVSGKLANTRTIGTIVWDLDLSVPMEEISLMQWTSNVKLDQFAVFEIDPNANVYAINGEFVHTIQDGSGYRRAVRIPPAKPASMDWMLEHSEHTRSQIERIREEDRAIATSRPLVTTSQTAQPHTGGGSPIPDSPATDGIDTSYQYVYVDDMSPWIVRAVLTAEDGDFFFYDGINPVTFADAIAINVGAGEVLFGASTISMQLIKMLFLDQKRIFARKIQEAFLVYLMEQHVPVSKERILELYLNLAEFGPGIFGVFDASRHYFDKPPSELTAGEATWIASILPSPKGYYRQFEEGAITRDGFRRMVALYKIMLERGRMTQEEYNRAIAGPPEFARR